MDNVRFPPSIYFGTKVKIATECFDNGTLPVMTFPFSWLSLKPSLSSNTDISDPTIELVKFALMSTLDGLRATKYPGLPDLTLKEGKEKVSWDILRCFSRLLKIFIALPISSIHLLAFPKINFLSFKSQFKV